MLPYTIKSKKPASSSEDEFVPRFKGGGLEQPRALAKKLNISKDDLSEVVVKGWKALVLFNKCQNITFNRGNHVYKADVKKIWKMVRSKTISQPAYSIHRLYT